MLINTKMGIFTNSWIQQNPARMPKGTLITTFVSNLKARVLKMVSGMLQMSKSLIRSLCTYSMRYSNECYTRHTFSRGAISIPKIKWLQSILWKVLIQRSRLRLQTRGNPLQQLRCAREGIIKQNINSISENEVNAARYYCDREHHDGGETNRATP